jgi:hypothetical protein
VSSERIEALLDEAYGLPPGPSQIALLEEAARLADTHGFDEQGFEIREELIHSCTFSGYPEKSLVAFSWCLARCDRDPELHGVEDILWKYKWVAGSLSGFPQISREQIDSMIADMKRRYQEAGAGLRPVYRLQCDLALDMGDFEAAREHQRRWESARRDWLTDCAACELDATVHYHLLMGESERAVEEAGPILAGRLRCNEVPHHTLARLLVPLLKLGRLEEAAECHQRGYRLIAGRREFVAYVANHLMYLALTDEYSRAVALFERHLPLATAMNHLSRRFVFYLAAAVLLGRLVENGKTRLPLRLPPQFRADDQGNHDIAALLEWANGELDELAAKFDRRNGNDYHRRQIIGHRELMKWSPPHREPASEG